MHKYTAFRSREFCKLLEERCVGQDIIFVTYLNCSSFSNFFGFLGQQEQM